MAIACPVDLDTLRLRAEIKSIYSRVAADPSGEFHFHRGPEYAAERRSGKRSFRAPAARAPDITTRRRLAAQVLPTIRGELVLGGYPNGGFWISGMAKLYFTAPRPGTYYIRHRPATGSLADRRPRRGLAGRTDRSRAWSSW